MGRQAGLTLLETTMASLVLAAGLAGIAGCFSYAVQNSIRVRQQTNALVVLSTKVEELKAEPDLQPGRGTQDLGEPNGFRLQWDISSDVPKRVTVVVSRRKSGSDDYDEFARATTLVGPRF